MIIDFTVENGDDSSVFVEDRLVACFRRNDGKTTMSKSNIVVDEIAIIIWAAMGLRISHFPYQPFYGGKCMMIDDASYAAHVFLAKHFSSFLEA